MGVPARIRPDAVPEGMIASSVETYVRNAHWYNAHMRRIG
jgi:hypothetical protein